MPSLVDARASNATFKPSYIPVAVFVGGTSGVGEAMAKALSSYLGGKLHLFIVGRNRAAAEKTFASLPRPEGVTREFLHCDALLMRNIVATSDELKSRVDKINFLVLSAGYFRVTGRDETSEGLDKLLVMRYYNRFKFAKELLPLLKVARDRGEDAQLMTVLGTGMMNIGVDRDDLGLRKNYRWWKGAMKPCVYNDVMVEEFAKQNPGIGFMHIYPGFVDTPAIDDIFTWWPMRLLAPLVWLQMYFFGVSAEECAEYMLYALLDKSKEGGWSRRDNHGNDIGSQYYSISEEDKKAVWEHSVVETDVSSSA
ncbi:NAD(P)-binding protein [Hymenopellis radicata]|nr:NAD(P)-binding protein [Hymenopellis radicata]